MTATATAATTATAALSLDGIDAGYGSAAVLRDVSVSVPAHGVVALLGANGAGKTTLLRVAAGLLRPTAGSIAVGGTEVPGHKAHRVARQGVCLVPEGRGIFRSLTVQENLLQFGGDADGRDEVLTRFPVLAARRRQVAGTLSGGEQQMLALTRAYLTRPAVALLDEVSMGLSPVLVDEIFASLRDLRDRGVALLVVEQYVHHALALADHVYVLARGQVVVSASPAELDQDQLAERYTG